MPSRFPPGSARWGRRGRRTTRAARRSRPARPRNSTMPSRPPSAARRSSAAGPDLTDETTGDRASLLAQESDRLDEERPLTSWSVPMARSRRARRARRGHVRPGGRRSCPRRSGGRSVGIGPPHSVSMRRRLSCEIVTAKAASRPSRRASCGPRGGRSRAP
jgi:hypothetical protein